MKGPTDLRQVLWVSKRPPGMEYCTVDRSRPGWALTGTLVRHFKKGTALVSYSIETDPRWRTRRVGVEQVFGGKRQSLKMEVRRSRWFRRGKEIPALRGCIDVDLGASPVTNTLPIKRVGSRKKTIVLKVAWVKFPSLEVLPLRQEYDRLGPGHYRYRSETGFKSELDTDRFGLVRKYGDYWIAVDPMPS